MNHNMFRAIVYPSSFQVFRHERLPSVSTLPHIASTDIVSYVDGFSNVTFFKKYSGISVREMSADKYLCRK